MPRQRSFPGGRKRGLVVSAVTDGCIDRLKLTCSSRDQLSVSTERMQPLHSLPHFPGHKQRALRVHCGGSC